VCTLCVQGVDLLAVLGNVVGILGGVKQRDDLLQLGKAGVNVV
jgi:hypothetical protein